MNDYALLRRYLEGQDDRAFKEIIDRYDPLVYRVAYAKCQDRQLAEDSTTAVFLLLANKASSFGPKSTLAGWLFHAARLMASNALREETRRRKREEQAAKMAMEAEIAENEAIDIETLEKVDDAIARLGSKQRDAVLLRYALGLTIAETAERLGITPVAASKRASRGLEETRRRVGLTTKALCALIAVKLANHSAEASAPATIAHGLISNSHIEMLYKAGIRHMTLIKLKIAASVALGTATLIGAGSSTAIKAQQSVETKLVSVSSLSKNAVKTPVPYSPTALGRDLGDFSAIYHVVGEYPNAKWAKDNAKTEMTKDFKKMIVDKQIISINGHSVTNISDFPIDSMVDSVQEIFGSALNSDVFDLTISQRGDNIVTKTSSDNGYVWLYNGKNTVHGFNNGYVTILSKIHFERNPLFVFPGRGVGDCPFVQELAASPSTKHMPAKIPYIMSVNTSGLPNYAPGWVSLENIKGSARVTFEHVELSKSIAENITYSDYHEVAPGLILPGTIKIVEKRIPWPFQPARVSFIRQYRVTMATNSVFASDLTFEKQFNRIVDVNDFTGHKNVAVRHIPGKLLVDELAAHAGR